MRITATMLFILILIVLTLAAVFSKYVSSVEGFITFNADGSTSNLSSAVVIKQYDPNQKVVKLYDRLYIDPSNRVLIDIDASNTDQFYDTLEGAVAKKDMSHNLIKSLTYVDQTGNYVSDTTPEVYDGSALQFGIQSKAKRFDNQAMFNFVYKSTMDIPRSEIYQVLYMGFGSTTVLHIFQDKDSGVKPMKVCFVDSGSVSEIDVSANSASRTWTSTGATAPTDGLLPAVNAGSSFGAFSPVFETVTMYSSTTQLHKLHNNIYYDMKNGHVVLKIVTTDGSNGIQYYKRTATELSNATTATTLTQNNTAALETTLPAASSPFVNYIVTADKLHVVYIANGTKTAVAVMQDVAGTSGTYSIISCVKYEGQAVATTTGTTAVATPATATPTTATATTPPESSALSDYYKWLAYWTSIGGSDIQKINANDYILKTEVIPPVCPACARCPTGGNCASCGETKGASGTSESKSSDGSKKVSEKVVDNTSDLLKGAGKGTADLLRDTGSGASSLARDAASGAGKFAKETASGTGQFVKDAAGGITSVARETTTGAVGLAKETVGGAVGLARETVGGAVGLVKDAASGVGTVLGGNRDRQTGGGQVSGGGYAGSYDVTNIGRTNYGGSGIGNRVNGYVYNGSYIQGRSGSNYIPMTTDFSAFGR